MSINQVVEIPEPSRTRVTSKANEKVCGGKSKYRKSRESAISWPGVGFGTYNYNSRGIYPVTVNAINRPMAVAIDSEKGALPLLSAGEHEKWGLASAVGIAGLDLDHLPFTRSIFAAGAACAETIS